MTASTETIVDQLKSMLAAEQMLGELSIDDVNDSTSLIEGGLDIDSIGIIEVISLAETTFAIEFQDEDLRLQTFDSIGALARVISSRMTA